MIKINNNLYNLIILIIKTSITLLLFLPDFLILPLPTPLKLYIYIRQKALISHPAAQCFFALQCIVLSIRKLSKIPDVRLCFKNQFFNVFCHFQSLVTARICSLQTSRAEFVNHRSKNINLVI